MSDRADHSAPPRLGRSYSFHFLWSSTFASGFADRLAMLAIAVMLGYGVKDELAQSVRLADASITAGYNFWFFLAYVVWGPFAGWLADRLPRKWLMFVADEARGLLILLAFILLPERGGYVPGLYETWIDVDILGLSITLTHTWKIWVMMFAIGMFAATFSPARNSIIPNVVGYHVLQRANAVVLGMGVIGNLFGFIIGGPLAGKAIHACVLVSALSYLLSGLMWPFLKTPVTRHDRPARIGKRAGPLAIFREVFDGGFYIARHRPILILTAVSIMFWSGSHIILAAGSAIAVDLYGGNVEQFAWIGGGFGLGMLLGAVLLGAINNRYGSEVVLTVGMFGAAVFLSLLAIVPVFVLGLVIAMVLGFFGGMIMIAVNTGIQQLTADHYRGRVMGFKDLASDLGGVVVSFCIWRMADADRHVLTVAHAFSITLVLAAAWGLWRYLARSPHPGRPIWNICWRAVRLACIALHQRRVVGARHVPTSGPALVVSNHQAGIDPVLIQASINRPIRYLMGTENMIAALGWLWRLIDPIRVHRTGRDSAAVRQAVEALNEGQAVGIFPEGGFGGGGAEGMKAFNRGVAMIARRAGCPIIPVWVEGPKAGSVWKALFLPSRSTVTFGRPFTIAELERAVRADRPDAPPRQVDGQVAAMIRQRVVALSRKAGSGAGEGDLRQ